MSTNTSGTGSGVTLAALGATLLFALTTIAAGIWGGMQYQALQASRAECAALEQRVASMKSDMDQMAARFAPMPPGQFPPPQPAPGMGFTPPPGGMPGMPPPPPIESENPMGAFMGTSEAEGFEARIGETVNMQIGSMYGGFLDHYGLTPEKRAQVEEILRAHMTERMRSGLDGGLGNIAGLSADPSTRAQAMQDVYFALEQNLRGQVSQVLSPRELADWDQYESTREERAIAKGLEMTLMRSGSMSSEGRDLAREVLAEETIAAMHRTRATITPTSDPATAMTQSVAAQSEAVRIARDRLTNTLTPGDMHAFDRFAESMRAQQQMVGGLLSRPTPALP